MSEPPALPRPRQVTLAAWLIMLGSVFVVLTVFQRISGLQSLDTQESVQRFLAEPPGDSLGLGVQGVLDILRTVAMVAGGCAAAAAILGYHVLQRNRGARLALTVLALPLFVTGMVAGGFMSSVVVAAAVMLWFQPARDWFDGVAREPTRNTRDTPRVTAGDRDGGAGHDHESPAQRTGPSGPRPMPGFGSATTSGAPVAPPAAWPAPDRTATVGAPDVSPPRPAAVLWACVLTWVFGSLAVLVMAASIAVLTTSPAMVFDEMHRQNPDLAGQGITDDLLRNLTYVAAGVIIAWATAAGVLAALTFRRVRWARTALVASAGGAGALCLVASALGQLVMVLPLAACIVTVALLVRPDVRAWFR